MSSRETTGAGSATVEVTAPGASGGHRVRSLSEILADRQLRSPTIQRERHEQLRSRLAPGPRASIDVEIGRLVCEFGDSVPSTTFSTWPTMCSRACSSTRGSPSLCRC